MKAIGKVRPVLAEMQTSGKSLAKKIGCTESPRFTVALQQSVAIS